MSEPRVWTLHFSDATVQPSNVHIKGPGVFPDGRDGFAVVELGPVLDLLERAAEALGAIKHWSGVGPHPLAIPLNDEIAALTERLGDSK